MPALLEQKGRYTMTIVKKDSQGWQNLVLVREGSGEFIIMLRHVLQSANLVTPGTD